MLLLEHLLDFRFPIFSGTYSLPVFDQTLSSRHPLACTSIPKSIQSFASWMESSFSKGICRLVHFQISPSPRYLIPPHLPLLDGGEDIIGSLTILRYVVWSVGLLFGRLVIIPYKGGKVHFHAIIGSLVIG